MLYVRKRSARSGALETEQPLRRGLRFLVTLRAAQRILAIFAAAARPHQHFHRRAG